MIKGANAKDILNCPWVDSPMICIDPIGDNSCSRAWLGGKCSKCEYFAKSVMDTVEDV